MYASKRRQRNFKRVRESTKPGAPTNPSKRHRERLNGELETVASLLPFDEVTLQRLDKLSVLRLAVSFLQIKAHFHVCGNQLRTHGKCLSHPTVSSVSMLMGPVPSFVDSVTGVPLIDPLEPLFSHVALKALGGFMLILNEQGEIYYVSENIEYYLGFLQSDILHQPIVDMIHSEDREDIRQGLQLIQNSHNSKTKHQLEDETMERTMIARFRCLLDNTCGFIRVEIRGRFTELHSTTQMTSIHQNQQIPNKYGLLAVCTPFVPPIQTDMLSEDPILKTKHSLDMNLLCVDARFKQIVEVEDTQSISFYELIHPNDVRYVAEAHSAVVKNSSAGLMIYRLLGKKSGNVFYVQTSLRVFFKNSKAESIGGTHRMLTEVDGFALLEKRATMKPKYLTFDDTLLQSPRHLSLQQSFLLKEPLSNKYDHLNEMPSTSNPINSSINLSNEAKINELSTEINTSKILPQSRELIQHPSTSSLPPTLHAHQNLSPLFNPPLLPIQLPDQNEMNGLFSNYFPTHHPIPITDAENLWSNGFKRPLELYPDPFAAYYHHPPTQFENAPYYIDYTNHPTNWSHQQQAETQPTSSSYIPRIQINELSHQPPLFNKPEHSANGIPVNLLQHQQISCTENLNDPSRYYPILAQPQPIPASFFPQPNEQQFGQLEVMQHANNFNFLSEVTQTLLGNHCQ